MKDWVLNAVAEAGINKFEAYDLIQCESRWQKEAKLINKGGKLGTDRGIWMINDKFHPEVSNSDAFDYKKATKAAIKIYKKSGNSFRQWTCARILGLK